MQMFSCLSNRNTFMNKGEACGLNLPWYQASMFLQIAVVPVEIFINYGFSSTRRVWNTEYKAKFAQITVSLRKKLSNTEYRNIARPLLLEGLVNVANTSCPNYRREYEIFQNIVKIGELRSNISI